MIKIHQFAVLFVSVLAFAMVTPAKASWSGPKDLISIQVVNHGGFLLEFASEVDPACITAGTNRLYVYSGEPASSTPVSSEGLKALLSLSMTAYVSNRPVTALYDESEAHCFVKYIRMLDE